ncbi:MAG: thioesterase family protein [Acidimicrobiia bacterium]|nr:thioesterase family protein [Acidimicrobiia bacterium]
MNPTPLPPNVVETIRAYFEEVIPFNRLLGLRVVGIDSEASRVEFDMRPDLVGNTSKGILHGGVISAVLDAVGGMAAIAGAMSRPELDDEGRLAVATRIGTIDLRVDYLRPAIGKTFMAVARTMRVGMTVAVTRMELHDEDDKLLAVGTGTYIVG